MLDSTRLEGMIIATAQQAIQATIETQVILQLLVKKKIVTREEVANTRNIVNNQPLYKNMMKTLQDLSNEVDEDAKFEELFKKSLTPNSEGKSSLTDEERDYLLSKFDNFKLDK